MKIKLIIVFALVLIGFTANSQTQKDSCKAYYLTFQSGFMIDGYNSMGVRTFFEYQKDFRRNWQIGISYEHSRHLGFAATDQLYELSTNLSLLSLNGYYKLNLIRNRLFWTAGFGIGAIHADWEDQDVFGATINASLTLNVRITKRIYIETSPLVVLIPINRVYFSTMDADHFNSFYAFTIFPVGIKVKL